MASFKVVAKREIPQHLKERSMPVGNAYVVDIRRTHAALARGDSACTAALPDRGSGLKEPFRCCEAVGLGRYGVPMMRRLPGDVDVFQRSLKRFSVDPLS